MKTRIFSLALSTAVLLAIPKLAAAADCTHDIPLAGAIATAHRTDAGIAWDARWIIGFDALGDFAGGRIPFAVPLPAGESMQSARDVTPLVEDGRISALCVEPSALDGRTIRASFTQSLSETLGAPIAAGGAVQIIDAAASEDLEVRGPVEAHVGFLAARGIGHDAREEALRLTNAPPMIARTFVFVRGTDVRAAGGLEGKLGARARAWSSAVGAGLAFLAVVGLLVIAANRLKKRASVERADAVLASEIDAVARPRRA